LLLLGVASDRKLSPWEVEEIGAHRHTCVSEVAIRNDEHFFSFDLVEWEGIGVFLSVGFHILIASTTLLYRVFLESDLEEGRGGVWSCKNSKWRNICGWKMRGTEFIFGIR